jgi:chromosome segregation protein
MGETSAKQLRGESMADVIFNGTTGRKPVGQASIELVFDNSAGTLGGQYAEYSEIAIKRQVTRDGQSNYYLNGTRCRRKDITDIFLGTGLGPRSYSIIEQGMISRLIEAKPEDLRIFIEEAAGISKYKERRRETENRIRHTRDNIDRINDLRDELEKRLEKLKRQASAAERYKELKQQERLQKAQLQALRWQQLKQEIDDREKQIGQQETALEARMATLRKTEATMEARREEQSGANEAFNQVQGEYYGVGAEIARLEQAIQHARDTRAQQERELAETEEAWSTAQHHVEHDRQKIAELSDHLKEDEAGLDEAKAKERVSSAALADSEHAMHQWQQEWDEFNTRASEQVRAAEVERARIDQLEQHIRQLHDRQHRLREEAQTFGSETLEADIVSLKDDLDRAARQVEELEHQLQEKVTRLREAKDEITEVNDTISGQRSALQQAREQMASLEALQDEAYGRHTESVNAWLEHQHLTAASRIAQEIEVATGWERATELVLGVHLEAVCADGLDSFADAVSGLNEGAIGLFDRGGKVVADEPARAEPRLLDKITTSLPLQALLQHVYVANDTADALARRNQLRSYESLITQDGVWVGPNWLRVARDSSAQSSVLEREQLLATLKDDVAQRTSTLADLEQQLETLRQRVEDLELSRNDIQAERNQAARQQSELNAQLTGKQTRLDNILARRQRLDEEITEQQQQIDRDEIEIEEARKRLNAALEATEGHDQQRDELIGRRDTCRLALEEVRKQALADRNIAHEIELRCQSMRAQLTATEENLERTQNQLSHLGRRRDELFGALSGGDQPIKDMTAELEQQLARRLEIEGKLSEARRVVEDLDHSLRELNEQRHQVEQTVQEMRSELDQHRLAWQEIKVRSETVLENINELSFQVEQLLEDMPENATVDAWQEELERISRAIQRLGNINLAAIDEYQEQEERKQYLDAQYEDLTDALTTLENAIAKIDRETRSRFKETFDHVNEGVQRLFPRLFGGGQAYLEMTGDDLLSTGVTIMARPPGKRNSTIHLLSGGEKALTAVAMVFAIFELNPAPFCMLDEVDAPLDDANVARFCQMVKEMSERVQFIFITHNKVTMEMAHQLTGVTMYEPGVSRLVAVDIDEAVEMAVA